MIYTATPMDEAEAMTGGPPWKAYWHTIGEARSEYALAVLEGAYGIRLWATIEDYTDDAITFTVEEGTYTVTTRDVLKILDRMMAEGDTCGVPFRVWRGIVGDYAGGECGNVDEEVADMIVQATAFGRLIYG